MQCHYDTIALFDHLLESVGGNMAKVLKIPSDRRFSINRRQIGNTGILNSQLVITTLHGWLNILKLLEIAAYLPTYCLQNEKTIQKMK